MNIQLETAVKLRIPREETLLYKEYETRVA